MTSTLRVIWPEGPNPNPPVRRSRPTLTLSQFYEDFFLPAIRLARGQSPGTIEQDRVALGHWQRITGDPPLEAIDDRVCQQFMLALSALSPATRRKTAIHLQAILYHAGPRSRTHRGAVGLLEDVPYLERPSGAAGDPQDGFTLEEIGLLLAAVGRVQPTISVPVADQHRWWRALILFAHHTALRVGNLLDARWSWLDADGWLHVPASYYKQRKPGRRFYVSTAAREAAESIRSSDDRMFAWSGSRSWLFACWRRINGGLPRHRRFCFKGFRRATLTWLAQRNALVARLVAGHRTLDVLEAHYIDRRVVVDLLEQLPRPAYHPPGPRQLTLFDL